MADEIIQELWDAKDAIAREHGYDVDSLFEHLRAKQQREGRRVVDLSARRNAPGRRYDMIHDVVSATYKGDYRIEVAFDDGKRGVVDFSKYAERGGVFERFRDLDFFRSFRINEELGVLTWGDEIDIAPETLYAEATGTPLPEWMTEKVS